MDPSELKKLEPTLKIIENYIAGNTIPRGNKSPQKLQRWLQNTIHELEEYDVYKTAGPYQRQVEEYLKRCRKLLLVLKNVIQWYKDLPKNSRQREWQMEFHRIGTSKYPGSKKILDGDNKMKMKLVRIVKKKDEDEQVIATIPDLLRSLAADELISYHAYTTGARLLAGSGWMDVNQEFTAHAKEELEHYEAILTRLWQLGEPVPTVFKSIPDMASYYWDIEVESPEAAAKIALESEKHAVETYRKLLVFISNQSEDEKDFVTQKLAKSNLETEEEHVQDIEHLLLEF